MNRRNADAKSGWVNFPTTDPKFTHTREGGMIVKLVVVEPIPVFANDPEFAQCCGAQVYDQLTECLVGDDQCAQPMWDNSFNMDQMDQFDQARAAWHHRHYPNIGHESSAEFTSIPYLASVVLASTGWSGYNMEKGESWICTYNDLTEEGKALYSMFQKLYPTATIHLLTFLDT